MEHKEDIRLTVSGKALSKGTYDYEFRLDKRFFESFDNTEILDPWLIAAIHFKENEGKDFEISVKISGDVVLLCDRCLERLNMPLSFQSMLGEEELAECLNACTGHYDFSQYVYDNVCLAIPIQRVHTLEKDCDPGMLRLWKQRQAPDHKAEGGGSFATLKDLIKQ